MPKKKPISVELPSDELVLAAIERAERHHCRNTSGVLFATLKEHLGLSRSGWSTRQLRPTWERLQADGLIQSARKSNCVVWSLTSTGQQRLEAVRQAGNLGALPESPQHRAWREARGAAGERIGEFRDELRNLLNEAIDLLDTESQVPSGAWYELNERLKRACYRVGSATHCLYEWPEPDDSHADIDAQGPPGQRYTRAWDR